MGADTVHCSLQMYYLQSCAVLCRIIRLSVPVTQQALVAKLHHLELCCLVNVAHAQLETIRHHIPNLLSGAVGCVRSTLCKRAPAAYWALPRERAARCSGPRAPAVPRFWRPAQRAAARAHPRLVRKRSPLWTVLRVKCSGLLCKISPRLVWFAAHCCSAGSLPPTPAA